MNGSGNLALGHSNPHDRLDVNGDAYIRGNSLWLKGRGDNAATRMRLHHSGTGAYIDWKTGRLAIRNDTTERVSILANGNVGINDTTPSYKLDVNGDINLTGSLRINGTAQTFGGGSSVWTESNSEAYYNGNVGIGTNNPAEKLDVNGTIYARGGTALDGGADGNGTECYIRFGAQTSSNDWCMLRQIGSSNNYHMAWDYHDDGTDCDVSWRDVHSSGQNPDLIYYRFHINGNGNVGVGTSSPSQKFHVKTGHGTVDAGYAWLVDGSRGIRQPSGNYGSVQTTGTGYGSWEGYSIDGRYVFMSDSNSHVGIYNDIDNRWLWYYTRDSRYHRFFANNKEMMRIYDGEIRLLNTGNDASDAFKMYTSHGGGMWGIRWNGSNYNVNAYVIMKDNNWPYSEHSVGRFENDSHKTNNINFTGQHKCMSVNNLDAPNVYGLIAYSTGNYMNIDNSVRPQMNESLPVCDLCTSDNDPRVFGVISDEVDINGENNVYGLGAFKTVWYKTNENEERLFMNSVGEGAIWVCNKNGNILNGDYITSCSVKGYGAKQADDILHNYTVAKITCDCDFSLTKTIKQKVKVNIITTTVEVQDVRLVNKTLEETKIVYDNNIQGYIETTVSKIEEQEEKLFETVPLYDSQGNQLTNDKGQPRTYERPIMKTITKTKKEIIYDSNNNIQYEDDLDTDGNQQMEYKYDTRFLNEDGSLIATEAEYLTKKNAGENVYIACFVGCTYHCG